MADKTTQKSSFWIDFLRKRQGITGTVMLLLIAAIALLAPWIAPYDPYATISATAADVLAPPGPGHLLGQDEVGRDVLSSVFMGSVSRCWSGFRPR